MTFFESMILQKQGADQTINVDHRSNSKRGLQIKEIRKKEGTDQRFAEAFGGYRSSKAEGSARAMDLAANRTAPLGPGALGLSEGLCV